MIYRADQKPRPVPRVGIFASGRGDQKCGRESFRLWLPSYTRGDSFSCAVFLRCNVKILGWTEVAVGGRRPPQRRTV